MYSVTNYKKNFYVNGKLFELTTEIKRMNQKKVLLNKVNKVS